MEGNFLKRRNLRQSLHILVLKPSFTHVAADYLFGDRLDCLPQPTIPDCIEAVSSGRATYAVVPLENALEGSVPMTIDYMFNENDLFINAEISIPIEQHLMVNKKHAEFCC